MAEQPDTNEIIVNAVIANNGTTSTAVDLPGGFYPIAIITPKRAITVLRTPILYIGPPVCYNKGLRTLTKCSPTSEEVNI